MAKKFEDYKGWIIIGSIIFVLGILIISFIGIYNGLVRAQLNVDEKWANVQSAYQRRADLVPNLVATVQGAADFEKETQTKITELRTMAEAAKKAMNGAKTPAEISEAANQVDSVVAGFRALNINVENYPQLKASQNFLSLQDQLEGTENRIKVERDIYNQAVKNYNIRLRTFPSNIVAGIFGFMPRDMFEAQAGSEVAPKVSFN